MEKKVKSIQVFRKPVEKANQGDRCGICLTNLDSKLIERGIASSPNYVKNAFALVINLKIIKYFKATIQSGSKFHITIGYETILGKIELFGMLNFKKNYIFINEINHQMYSEKFSNFHILAMIDFNFDSNEIDKVSSLTPPSGLVIGSKLDTDIHLNQCRLAFHGNILHLFNNKSYKDLVDNKNVNTSGESFLSDLKIYKEKSKQGVVERKHDEFTLICRSLFKKETLVESYVNMKVNLSTGDIGSIMGTFGQSGKIKIRIENGLSDTAKQQLDNLNKKESKPIYVELHYKKYIFGKKNKLFQ